MLVRENGPLQLGHGGHDGHGGRLEGPCVDWTREVRTVEYAAEGEDAGAADDAPAALFPAENTSAPDFDVDGDGQADATIAAGAVDVTTQSDVYIVRGSCGYRAGSFDSTSGVRALPHRAHGLADLVTTVTDEGPTAAAGAVVTYELVHRFDGRTYRVVSRRRVKARDPRVE